jgi:predicted PurR-regulated permease PerM
MRWLTFALAALYGWIGLAGSGAHRVFALAGALCIAAAPLVARSTWVGRWTRAVAVALLVAGAVPFAVVAWWSIAAPLIGALALVFGWFAIRSASEWRQSRDPAPIPGRPADAAVDVPG